MSEPYLGEIKIVTFNFPPKGWAICNGQLLPINQNQALFSLLGTTYGGDGRVNFALPNLQGRNPIHMGSGITLGQLGGEQSHTLLQSELPTHTHLPVASANAADQSSPIGHLWAGQGQVIYSSNTPNATLAPQAIANTGGSQPHPNQPPYLVLNFVIALQGIFPSQT